MYLILPNYHQYNKSLLNRSRSLTISNPDIVFYASPSKITNINLDAGKGAINFPR